jgi:hypothetical protein
MSNKFSIRPGARRRIRIKSRKNMNKHNIESERQNFWLSSLSWAWVAFGPHFLSLAPVPFLGTGASANMQTGRDRQ